MLPSGDVRCNSWVCVHFAHQYLFVLCFSRSGNNPINHSWRTEQLWALKRLRYILARLNKPHDKDKDMSEAERNKVRVCVCVRARVCVSGSCVRVLVHARLLVWALK